MKNPFIIFGVLFLLAAIFSYIFGQVIIAIIALIISGYFIYQSLRTSPARADKKIGDITYNGIMDIARTKYNNGTFHVDLENFAKTVSNIRDIIVSSGKMPEFGLDSIFLVYFTQASAENAYKEITKRGVKAQVMQEKNNWYVRIEFE
ncbi:hypothetical protein [Picrophilus oshimae]|uniref:Hypothetical exported protein n=1 Tax=Picrophilus torridus (strain ATCC 700027 / DSM 9790 / JCM 10055 / NBRC 100828 / KAW 2/3) TaxID=1122961 RepID=Q6L2I3_PICTO|nr:hypothetical protein [Picrophilus oshimae]AAT42819.1 hypothetical exported protein [Picrophilus oshimae DSM 9789]